MRRMFWVCLMVLGLILSWTLVYAADFYVIPTKKKNYAPVQKTGQTPTVPLSPALPGSDGDLQKGVAWPSPRFTDNTDGTVTDNLTGLIWLKNAECFGARTWTDALSDCNSLANGSCSLTDSSVAGAWRLPNRFELESLLDLAYYSPALSNDAGTAKWTSGEGSAFTGVELNFYWSSSTFATYPVDDAWGVSLFNGDTGSDYKGNTYYVWPVRSGQ